MDDENIYVDVQHHYQRASSHTYPNNDRSNYFRRKSIATFATNTPKRYEPPSDFSACNTKSPLWKKTLQRCMERPLLLSLVLIGYTLTTISLGILFGFLIFRPSSTTTSPYPVENCPLTCVHSPSSTATTMSSAASTTSLPFLTTSTSTSTSSSWSTSSTTTYTSSLALPMTSHTSQTISTTASNKIILVDSYLSTVRSQTWEQALLVFAFLGTTTSLVTPDFCPPVLPNLLATSELLTLDQTTAPTAFRKYSHSYFSPSTATKAVIRFYFSTDWGTWHLDDVSVKRSGTTGPELIDNGGFESGVLGAKWKFCDSRYSWITAATVSTSEFNAGRYAYESQYLDVGSDEYLSQTFDVQGNTQYAIEFFLFVNGGDARSIVTLMAP